MANPSSNIGLDNAEPILIVGPDSGPELPFPLRLKGEVIRGFGRGSKELGMPTANIPIPQDEESNWITDITSGVYFGWCSILFPANHSALTSHSHIPSATFLPSDYVPPPVSVQLSKESTLEGWRLYPMVMTIGYNPYYKNMTRSVEVHVLHGFSEEFYGSQMRVSILGFIRGEKNYDSLDQLIQDIKVDCEVTRQSLGRPNWDLASSKWSKEVEWLSGKDNIYRA